MFAPRRVRLKNGWVAVIRRGETSDAEGLIANVNSVGGEGIYILVERLDTTPDQERDWIAKFDGENSLLLVATVDGILLGALDIDRQPFEKTKHLAGLGIAIQKEARGVGLGHAMTEAGIVWARSRGVKKLSLSVFDSNEPAKALYRSLGFIEEGKLKGHVVLRGTPVDLVLMALWL
jgi:ribosomal protein S18 acetylase RimI-like enzyme